MKLVTLTNAVHFGKTFSGTFQVTSAYTDVSWNGPRAGKVGIIRGGKDQLVWVNRKDVKAHSGSADDIAEDAPKVVQKARAAKGALASVTQIHSEQVDVRSDAEIGVDIEKRFSVMNRMTDGVVNGMVKSVIISGAPGVGKSFELEAKLEKAEGKGKIKFVRISGTVSGIFLYKTLFQHSEKNCVVVLDDADRAFGDEDTMNVLKAALDTGKKRVITWGTDSKTLREEDIPNSFEFKGNVVFITNMNFDRVIASGSKMAPHMAALMSRAPFIDLGIHSHREIMVRIEQVVKKGDVMSDHKLSKGQKEDAINWVRANHNKMRTLSIREVLHLGDMIAVDPKGWRELAEVTMFKPTRHF
jgi:hypothetical protein